MNIEEIFAPPRFRLISFLGAGGFGSVYLAFDNDIKQICALKFLHKRFSANLSNREQFLKEARLWLTLGRHPNVVSAYAVDVFNNQIYICLEYIPPDETGKNTLHHYLKRPIKNDAFCVRIVLGIAFGLKHIYKNGILAHKDLKPANIMTEQDGCAKITDFGLSEQSHGKLETFRNESVSGTPLYMSPEQFQEGSLLDHRADFYSLGIILHQLCMEGQFPFEVPDPGPGIVFSVFRYLHNTYILEMIDSPFANIITRCLQKDPKNRYPSIDSLIADLQEIHKSLSGTYAKEQESHVLSARHLTNQSASFFMLGDHAVAESLIDEAISISPLFHLAINNKACFLAQRGKTAESILLWEKIIKANPSLGRPFYNLGNVKMAVSDFDEAIRLYRRCLILEPDYIPALSNLAICLDKSGLLDAACEAYGQCILASPNDAIPYYNLGYFHFENDHLVDASRNLQKCLMLNPQHVSALNYLGLICLRIRNINEAIAYFQQALVINPSYKHALSNLEIARQMIDQRI